MDTGRNGPYEYSARRGQILLLRCYSIPLVHTSAYSDNA